MKAKDIAIVAVFILIIAFISMAIYNTFFREDAPDKIEIQNPSTEDEIIEIEVPVETDDRGNWVDDGEYKDVVTNDAESISNIVSIDYNGYKVSFGYSEYTGSGLVVNPVIEGPNPESKYLIYYNDSNGESLKSGEETHIYADNFKNIKYMYCTDTSLTGKNAAYVSNDYCGILWRPSFGEYTGYFTVTVIDYTNFKLVGTFKVDIVQVDNSIKFGEITVDTTDYSDAIAAADTIRNNNIGHYQYFQVKDVYAEKINVIYYNSITLANGYQTIPKAKMNMDDYPLIAVTYSFEDAPILLTIYLDEYLNYYGRVSFDNDSATEDLQMMLGLIEDVEANEGLDTFENEDINIENSLDTEIQDN